MGSDLRATMKTKFLDLIEGNAEAKGEESVICWSCSVTGMHDTFLRPLVSPKARCRDTDSFLLDFLGDAKYAKFTLADS